MKYPIKKIKLLSLLTLLFMYSITHSQVTNTGGFPPDHEIVTKCVDSSGTKIGFFEVWIYRPAFSPNPVLLNRWRADGSVMVSIPSGAVNLGECSSSMSVTQDTVRSISIIYLCDNSLPGDVSNNPVSFYRVVQNSFKTGTGYNAVTTLGNFRVSTGASYTPSANVSAGPCFKSVATGQTRITSSGSSSITDADGFESWEICNVGIATGTITLSGGSAINVIPGECVRCAELADWTTKPTDLPSGVQWICGSPVNWNATGTEFRIHYRSR